MNFVNSPREVTKKKINDILFSLLEAEDDYDESSILLQKIVNGYTIKFIKYKYLNLVSQLNFPDTSG